MKTKKHFLFLVVRIFSLFPICLWPTVFFGSLFFDSFSFLINTFLPGRTANSLIIWGFIALNAYPLLLEGNLVFSTKVYAHSKIVANALVLWPNLFLIYLLKLFLDDEDVYIQEYAIKVFTTLNYKPPSTNN